MNVVIEISSYVYIWETLNHNFNWVLESIDSSYQAVFINTRGNGFLLFPSHSSDSCCHTSFITVNAP